MACIFYSILDNSAYFHEYSYALIGSAHIYWISDPWRWSTLNMGFVLKRPSKMQEQCFFRSRARRAAVFGRGQKFRGRAAPARIWNPYKVVGGSLLWALVISLGIELYYYTTIDHTPNKQRPKILKGKFRSWAHSWGAPGTKRMQHARFAWLPTSRPYKLVSNKSLPFASKSTKAGPTFSRQPMRDQRLSTL